MNEQQTYSRVDTGDFIVSSTDSPESMQQALALPEPTEAIAEPTPAEPTEKVATPGDERNADGTFKKAATPRNNPVERMKTATAKEAEAKREREAATKERDDARAEAARYRQELETLRAPKPVVRDDPQPVARVAAPVADPEPDPSDTAKYPDGQFDRKFINDTIDHRVRQQLAAGDRDRAEAQKVQQQARFRSQVEAEYAGRLAKAKKEIPDFEARVKTDTPFNMAIFPHFMTLEDAPQILIYLSEHQDDAQRLAALHPSHALGELGRISERLAAAQRGSAPVVIPSKATAPITPLGGGAHATIDPDSDNESPEQHHARFLKEVRAGRR